MLLLTGRGSTAARLKRPAGGERKEVDADAVAAKYKAWLRRQPLADRSREAYLAQVSSLELMEASFSHVRSFAPQVLGALSFAASVVPSEVLDAVRLLQTMNTEGRRHVPEGARRGSSRRGGRPTSTPPVLPGTRAATSTTGSCACSLPSEVGSARGRSGCKVPDGTPTPPPT